ncbi:MAG: A/G-specific adenine glycosylase [Planctomycetes bacterium]|nr:A/G-specific adenine glycosylase [Planctomycetota bacterium]
MPRHSAKSATPDTKVPTKALIRLLLRWYRANARDLPWRHSGPPGQRDPYQTLVSEFMLQQTQVSRVLEKFEPFLKRFPTLESLATAPESAVLTAWSGLGYYRRARLLHTAAQDILNTYGGNVPHEVETLLNIRGIGPYTAGALASIAFDQRVPLVDGNVSRVLQRVLAKPGRSAEKEVATWTWQTAESWVLALPQAASPGMFNEALMELGATVCTPKAPRCHECPWQDDCAARARGLVDSIPTPKLRIARPQIHLAALLVDLGDGQILIEDRNDSGLFANLTQPPMLEIKGEISPAKLKSLAAKYLDMPAPSLGRVQELATMTHTLTHRELHITAFGIRPGKGLSFTRFNRRAASREDLSELPLANIQRKLLVLGFDFASEATPRRSRRG